MSKLHTTGKAIVVLAIALLFSACTASEKPAAAPEKSVAAVDDSVLLAAENAAMADIRKGFEDKRSRDGDRAARLLAPFREQVSAGTLTEEEFKRIKLQLDNMYLGIGQALHLHQLDLALMQYTVSIAEKVRPPLVARIKNGLNFPVGTSPYIKETLMADFEQTSADAIKKDQSEIEFWNAESLKWRKSWDEKTYDYVLPQKARGQFLFDYESKAGKGANGLESLEESINRQLKIEIEKALKNSKATQQP